MTDGVVMILAVHAGIAVFYLSLRWLFGPLRASSFIGYYLVLMPLGFAAWADASLWLVVAFAVAGLVVLTWQGTRGFAR